MMEESLSWDRNRFHLAGKWVESPHTATQYVKEDTNGARYFWSGQELQSPKKFPRLLEEAAEMVEKVVNEALDRKGRYSWEWKGKWKANLCGANRYDGAASSVGWHADQLTYLGPYATIASLSLGTPRGFRLRPTTPVDPAFALTTPTRTYEVKLGHNTLVLMNAGCQERYKHTVPTQKALDLFRPAWAIDQSPIPPTDQKAYASRINLTFRFYRETSILILVL
ncbi:hypothetical protein TREMEDRAFT_39338, partial [Tremella mesenterica DSM 1558]|uniref:uncharacterized protein n=1 Tax=Tremella mesenterica (strain ATCC 24925 / CBS 8224 / DSM 1558 / NBRC 9311 / NRRL Y-6157 / RJB 2259-6 / UBC 559-6) TaxID=578456 RepID=UPI0003F4A0B1